MLSSILTDLVEGVDKCRYDGAVQLSLADKTKRRNTLTTQLDVLRLALQQTHLHINGTHTHASLAQ